ncbi:hypothetical protein NLJ89_g5466 [Agrocybe chaxingu]|uniref:Uncharacterized protein n=1 Tax=Agrocybe chaxingu TaxID=84603 RepID=A0A9W8K173_9AGAR|nr:hypothetical protein NLJ89_g5466 [Agrocybe chaxingu]
MTSPTFDMAAWIKNNIDKTKAKKSSSKSKAAGADGWNVESEVKRLQNALPTWRAITCNLTTSSVKENATEAVAMAAGVRMADDSTRKVYTLLAGVHRETCGVRMRMIGTTPPSPPPRQCPLIGLRHLPPPLSPQVWWDSPQTVNANDAEAMNHDVNYLDSSDSYRKRARSQEDVGGNSKAKVVNVELNGTPDSTGGVDGQTVSESRQLGVNWSPLNVLINGCGVGLGYGCCQKAVMDASPGASAEPVNDLMVTVAGSPKTYSRVTDGRGPRSMTPEEYETYFEVLQARLP